MNRLRFGATVAVMFVGVVTTATRMARTAEPSAAAGAPPGSTGDVIRQVVSDLGYDPVVGERCVAFSRVLPVDRWRAAIDAARDDAHTSGAAGLPAVETRVIDELQRRLDAVIRQADGDTRYWNLPLVLADRQAQCLGNCQLWYVFGSSVGLNVGAVEVSRPAAGELGEHETHVATLIRLADGRVCMIDTRYGIESDPLRFGEVYRRDGAWWTRADLAGHRTLHRRVRPLDHAGIEAAILLNIGNTYRRASRDRDASPIYDRGLSLDPQSPALHLAAAETHLRDGTWDDAERSIRTAIDLDPQSSDAHAAFARLLMRRNQWADAVASFDRALALKPLSPDAIQRREEAVRRRDEATCDGLPSAASTP
jgi:tetratricopeptide (TPR) repeat protein